MRAGLMLAAGESSRLPNKALLPLWNHKPAITSGVDMLLRSGCNVVVIVVSRGSVIEPILRALYPMHNFRFVYQDNPLGVGDALRCAWNECKDFEDVVVTFCDNVFDNAERAHGKAPCAAIRFVTGDFDGWNDKWVMRDTETCKKLAGWYILRPHHLNTTIKNSIEFLNSIDASPILMFHEWWDIGTLDAYREYWK